MEVGKCKKILCANDSDEQYCEIHKVKDKCDKGIKYQVDVRGVVQVSMIRK